MGLHGSPIWSGPAQVAALKEMHVSGKAEIGNLDFSPFSLVVLFITINAI